MTAIIFFLRMKLIYFKGDAYWKSRTAVIKLVGIPSYMLESRSSANTG